MAQACIAEAWGLRGVVSAWVVEEAVEELMPG